MIDVSSASDTYRRITINGVNIQRELRAWLPERQYSHWVTLNFHYPMEVEKGARPVRLWSMNIMERMFRGPQFAEHPVDELFSFMGFPEFTADDDLHYHLLTWVHPDRRIWFNNYAGRAWKGIIATGTAHIDSITQTAEDQQRVTKYATKYANRAFSSANFLPSNIMGELSNPADRRQSKCAR